MNYCRALIVSLLTLVILAGNLFADTPAGKSGLNVSSGQVVVIENFESELIPARDILVWLPEGFAEDRQYAALYMHDGGMLFDASTTYE